MARIFDTSVILLISNLLQIVPSLFESFNRRCERFSFDVWIHRQW
jgi:hypothetical protein